MPGGKKQAVVEEVGEDSASEASGVQDSTVMAMMKAMFEEQRKAEQVREQQRRREELERREIQKQMEERQYAQQVALLKLQQEVGEKARMASQDFHEAGKKRDRFLFTMSNYQEGGDLEEYFAMAERKMEAAKLPREDWPAMIEARLVGRVAMSWRDLIAEEGADFQVAKGKLLKSYGYTSKVAAETFFGFKIDYCKGMTADLLYGKGQQLLRRIVAPAKLTQEIEYPVLKGWVYSFLPRRAKMILDSRIVDNAADLVGALQDFLSMEGEKGDGQTASFKKISYEHRENRENRERSNVNCFNCGKIGHKASECWGPKAANVPKPGIPKVGVAGNASTAGGGAPMKIICFTCGIEGHKSPDCPKRVEKPGKDAKLKSIKRVKHGTDQCAKLDGRVNEFETPILLDTGATVSVVLETMVSPDQMTGENVLVRGFGVRTPMKLPMAKVGFVIGELQWEEEVAVAPVVEGSLNEVIYGLNLRSKRGKRLVAMVDENSEEESEEEVKMVVTRSMANIEKQEELEEALENAQDGPTVVACDVSRQKKEVPVTQEVKEVPVRQEVPVVQEEEVPMMKEIEQDVLGDLVEEGEMKNLCFEQDASDEEKEEEEFVLKKDQEGEPEIEVPIVKVGSSRKDLEKETRDDPTLERWRDFAEQGEQGLFWRQNLLFQSKLTHTEELEDRLVLPKKFREKVLEIAHDSMQHMGARRVKALLSQRFAWPGLGQEVIDYIRSCDTCQKCSKRQKKVPMVERQVMAEPFESMAIDIVGPFPKGRGGCRFLLTGICMASRWPEALPLKSITAKAVALG